MKDIKGYEGLYAITSCGKVWSYRNNRFLCPIYNEQGYLLVDLCKDGEKKRTRIHRLVAEAYIPNPDNLPEVNHKDEVKSNNCVSNLEWCNTKYNSNYGTAKQRTAKKLGKTVYCVELDKIFISQSDAARELGICLSQISSVCNGKRETAKGYHFLFCNDKEDALKKISEGALKKVTSKKQVGEINCYKTYEDNYTDSLEDVKYILDIEKYTNLEGFN